MTGAWSCHATASAFAAAGASGDALAALEEALVLVPRDQVRERAEMTIRIADVKLHSSRAWREGG
jgi:hypothetical protein